MDLHTVRAEIKAWERDFKATHGRDPTIQEIKEKPAIAAKYKLYKSLSKNPAAAAAIPAPSSRSATTPPPPTRQPPSSSILPKARAVKVDPPLSTSNPFSPVKNRKKLSDPAPSSQRASNQSRSNPFATPSKPKHKHPTPPSPDPFPPIQPLLLVPRPPSTPAADAAVTRARKRLRGEPVSPSPVKEKRPRVSSHAALAFAGPAARIQSPDDSDGDEIAADPNDTVIDATPLKPLTVGRSFKALFDDSLPNAENRPAKASSSRKKAASPAATALGIKRDRSRALTPSSDEDEDWTVRPRLKSLSAAMPMQSSHSSKAKPMNSRHGIPKALVPRKDNLWSDIGPSKPSRTKSSSTIPQSQRGSALPMNSNKRPLPDDCNDTASAPPTAGGMNAILIPPSPPPPDSSRPGGTRLPEKGKARAAPAGRKKAKLAQDTGSGDEDSMEDEIQVKEIDPLAYLHSTEHDGDSDFDWEAQWRARPPPEALALSEDPNESGKFEVNLPDDLQRILAISPGAIKRESEDEKVVRGLLYGSREMHYDPSKGGEIWDVGEDSEHADGTEEDWEGEPVPWETGEL